MHTHIEGAKRKNRIPRKRAGNREDGDGILQGEDARHRTARLIRGRRPSERGTDFASGAFEWPNVRRKKFGGSEFGFLWS